MLVLTVSDSGRVRLQTSDGPIWVMVLRRQHRGLCLGFEAPESVVIEREKIIENLDTTTPKAIG